MADKKNISTVGDYGAIKQMFDILNEALFKGALPPVYFTINTRLKSGLCGYFKNNSFVHTADGSNVDEIALNPQYFGDMKETCQTLAHEMCHLWQYTFGKPSRTGYHNKEWGQKMETIGLTPSHTGQEGGRKTGQKMADYVTPGGRFEKLLPRLTNSKLKWKTLVEEQRPGSGSKAKKDKNKYSCSCGQNIWGKPGLRVRCADCNGEFVSYDTNKINQRSKI